MTVLSVCETVVQMIPFRNGAGRITANIISMQAYSTQIDICSSRRPSAV